MNCQMLVKEVIGRVSRSIVSNPIGNLLPGLPRLHSVNPTKIFGNSVKTIKLSNASGKVFVISGLG